MVLSVPPEVPGEMVGRDVEDLAHLSPAHEAVPDQPCLNELKALLLGKTQSIKPDDIHTYHDE
eukprot:3031-Eustigmatos_ZCMA.PRE.1